MIARILDVYRHWRAVRIIRAWPPPPAVTVYIATRAVGDPLIVVLDAPHAYLVIPGVWLHLTEDEARAKLDGFAAQLLEPDDDEPSATVTQAGLHFAAALEIKARERRLERERRRMTRTRNDEVRGEC